MNVTMIGATGRTGTHLLDLAAQRGHRITALTRSPASSAAPTPWRGWSPAMAGTRPRCGGATGADAVIAILAPRSPRGPHEIAEVSECSPRR